MRVMILVAVAALLLTTVAQHFWDASQMIQVQADDKFFSGYAKRGNDAMCAMRSSDRAAGKQIGDTRYPVSAESYHALWHSRLNEKWKRTTTKQHWFQVPALDIAYEFDKTGWGGAIDYIGGATGHAGWICSRYQHKDPNSNLPLMEQKYSYSTFYEKDRKDLVATGAIFNTAVNRQQHFVIAQWRGSPEWMATINWGRSGLNPPNPVRKDELPGLRYISDFIWTDYALTFKRDDATAEPLRAFGVMQVGDVATLRIVARLLLQRQVWDLEEWPATNSIFSMNTEEGLALLGAPPGMIVAKFLVEHKKWLGLQHVTSVRVFRGAPFEGGKRQPQLLFELAQVPQDLQYADPPPDFVPPPAPVIPAPEVPWAPGPSTPRAHAPGSTPRAAVSKDSGTVSYNINHEARGKNTVRVHIFRVI